MAAGLAGMSGAGALLGLLGGAGLALLVSGLPSAQPPELDDRLAAYLNDAAPASRLLHPAEPTRPRPVLQRLLAPVMADAVRWVERVSGGPGSVHRRLDQLGPEHPVEQFRAEQVVWGVLGAAAGVLLGLVVSAGHADGVVPVLGLLAIGALTGVLGRDHLLTVQVRRREQRMLAEFPTVAELLALAVVAGEGAMGALERVARTCRGELSVELRRVLADARAGTPLVQALERLSTRTSLPSLARFVDGLVVAVDRGTPLADVLHAQAQDVRELTRRRLIESGGRREIGMLLPVVFLVLPVTVLFAVYPGLALLELDL